MNIGRLSKKRHWSHERCGVKGVLSTLHSRFLLLVAVARLPAPCAVKGMSERNNCSWRGVKTCGMALPMDRSNATLVAAFAHALREARQGARMTQEDLADRADVSVRFISLLETGKRQPSLSAMAAISAGLGLPMSVLVAAIERKMRILGDDADLHASAELEDNTKIAG